MKPNMKNIIWMLFTTIFLLVGTHVWAQNAGTVSGIITDTEGEPLPGAFVFYKGTKNGVTTDIDGKYSIAAPASGKAQCFC